MYFGNVGESTPATASISHQTQKAGRMKPATPSDLFDSLR
ncbi:hypothetical protein SynBIOSE41_00731 [Synechococcus sp. BIOS-E4-1]|nr:hypothetical protein SynBIOSE41_00731 [Synechococcus sp. BIOS-E4-1]